MSDDQSDTEQSTPIDSGAPLDSGTPQVSAESTSVDPASNPSGGSHGDDTFHAPEFPVLAGWRAQAERLGSFLKTADPIAAERARVRIEELIDPMLPQLREQAHLPAEPEPGWHHHHVYPVVIDSPDSTPPGPVFTYWNSPDGSRPPLIDACLTQMQRVYPDLMILDADSVSDLIEVPERITTLLQQERPAHYSDYVRTKVLAEHGGIWLDASLWVDKPVQEHYPDYLIAGTIFPRWTEKHIGNWFIASMPQTPLISMLYEGLDAWWNNNDDLPDYFLYHRLFEVLDKKVPEIRQTWKATPSLSALDAHLLQVSMMEPYRPEHVTHVLEQSPIQKLSYKYDSVPAGSTLEYLLSQR